MQGSLFYIGKGLQLLGLVWAPYALYVGVTGQDSRKELMLLLVAAFQFILGYLLIRISGARK
jgi:hypothetical protein